MKFLRMKEVQAQLSLSRSHINRLVAQGSFPQPVPLANSRIRGFVESEVEEWAREQVRAARPGAAEKASA